MIQPSTARFVRKVKGTSLSQASLAYYKSRQGYTLQRKRGKTSVRDPVAQRLNRFVQANPKLGQYISYIYSAKSRVLRGTENLLAVKLNSGAKGWITTEGRFVSEEQLRNTLHSVDCTSPAAVVGVSLRDIYESLTTQQKAEFADKVRDFDWDAMFEEMYPEEGEASADQQMDAYLELLETLGDIAGWDKR